jgi:S-adenosyl-L-methionine hydrolase (adenosine-forming)
VSRTFHGRDVFAPAAAHLAAGVPPSEFGDEVDLDDLVDLALPAPTVSGHVVAAPVRDIDRFGNVRLAATAADLARASGSGVQRLEIRVPRSTRWSLGRPSARRFRTNQETFEIRQVGTYSDLKHGELGLLVDSFGWLAVVMDRDNAARRLRVDELDVVKLVAY